MDIQDAIKLLFQKNLGCGHMLAAEVDYAENILRESKTLKDPRDCYIEVLGDFSRLYLKSPPDTFFANSLAKLFVKSGECSVSMSDFIADLDLLCGMTREGELPFDAATLEDFIFNYREDNYPIMSHSNTYKNAYHPAYRVINTAFTPYLEVLCEMERLLATKDYVKMAIEGGSATGKSTLAELIESLYDCNVIHTDDFFLPVSMRTGKRLSTPGGNVHYERFREEVGDRIKDKDDILYSVYDCSNDKISTKRQLTHKKLVLIEGVYAMHPDMGAQYDLAVFCKADKDTRLSRILKRNGTDMTKRFIDEWIPMEDEYFCHFNIENSCDIKVAT